MKGPLLITVTGVDRPGVTSTITSVLDRFGIHILDIGQAVIHDALSLGLLIDIPEECEHPAELETAVLDATGPLGLTVRFVPVDRAAYEYWVHQQSGPRHIVTLLARRITAHQLSRLSGIVADHGLNIDKIARLSGRVPLAEAGTDSRACVEFALRGPASGIPELRSRLMELANELDVDIAYQEDNLFRRNRRLVAFDMDSTLIRIEVIDELARHAGAGHEVAAITERAMRGELDFRQSLRERVSRLEGLPERVLEDVARSLPLTDGAERLVTAVKKLGYKTAIISGGFGYFGRELQRKLGIDHVHANELEIRDGRLTGRVQGEIIDGARKAELLKSIAAEEGISLEQAIAVGDGANDLEMLRIAGLGIAFRAKPVVRAAASQSISTLGLDGILYLMGMSDRET